MTASATDAGPPGRQTLSGELTFATVPDLYHASLAWFADKSLAVDFAQISKTDSAGLALMTEWLRLAREKNCRVEFLNIPEQVQEFIRVSGLQDVLLKAG
ncbi:MAG: STAS domain-containing protein [Gammaproteobacteria bacterium]|nr:STAS domain-containing protein [Gammaproteobacteria bacterium]